ncbi:hypothetical protein CGRA01v4_00033 [Colletotrichum graminicola]|uniref:DUF1479 domain-containing protein n=1 Tax=Colletotrichum graminicola (strain M1.001 / M2 / FGSC 10212) TaxID=645133 RepID=E3QXB3_COLGM|nr:uncharacterized protein GLRG_10645 [Colletotrichum graminicola M1.001]EFQ35501.1 hypothetical protein GLRG_10645 [Colletotrichum graminicola M1.001]WDK08755.1 hypothetical protein CGRA01v4_00033 [Colletotrichum graminicola]
MILARLASGPTEALPANGEGGKGGGDGDVGGGGGGGGGGPVGVGVGTVGDSGNTVILTGPASSRASSSTSTPAATAPSVKSPTSGLGRKSRRGLGSGARTGSSSSSGSGGSISGGGVGGGGGGGGGGGRRTSSRVLKTTPPSSTAVSRATSVSPTSALLTPPLSTAATTAATTRSSTSTPAAVAAAASRKVFPKSMEPPVVSFYGAEPIPLPSRFAGVKKRLIAGHEAAVEASWRRLLDALRTEIADIQDRGSELIPSINFTDINDPVRVEAFAHRLRRYGVAVIRGVVSPNDARGWVQETHEYLDKNREFKPPALHDPTCIDLFWTPVQVRARAHPNMLRAQKFAMSFWESTDDLHITRAPVSYADRLRIHNDKLGAVGQRSGNSAADSLSATASSTVIAQIDSGSLERWEPDGYGRGGTYEAVFRGDWESYDPWDPAGRVGATTDLYNGEGACSVFRMFQGILALTKVEQGMVRVLPSPKLVAAYFLLRPFFSPKRGPPEQPDGGKADQWAAYLDASNWALDPEPNTIIHGAVPGHAQRLTERWHPHLHLRRSLVSLPSLRAGDYVIWHCDQAYSIITGGTRLGVPQALQNESNELSLLTYTPVCPLTQTNALFLARQRKAFQTGQPGPDFDTLGGLGSEASHQDRPGAREVEEYGGVDGLRAMGLAPYDVEPAGAPPKHADAMDVDNEDNEGVRNRTKTEAETELLRLANIILFPSRYDFYIPTSGTRGSGDRTPRAVAGGAPKTMVNGNKS